MTMTVPDLSDVIAAEPRRLAFATVSGAHLYGFPSQDSDVDLRGAHVLPAEEVVGLVHGPDTVDRTWDRAGTEIDLVTHDIAKFATLLLRRNGYVLEQLLSPLVVHTSEEHRAMIDIAPRCVTSSHAHHYLGFAGTQWRLFVGNGELKPLLYTFRALLTGIHLMRTGETVAHLPTLAENLGAPAYLAGLIDAKRTGEHRTLGSVPDAPVHSGLEADVERLRAELEQARDGSHLPVAPPTEPTERSPKADLHDLIVRMRLA
ncbi:hypothetical protein EV193_108225 [Herbihabitans rhizosphaerae]|uniref:Nucleotidyltransferase n=1 Tax=Herbihabitans rhizosphaerae TaxID=1872711 RepID=A0A4Q7KKQ7_9PSEU|nr:nucleotidyltransferase domain-containing protein [Herbihabitans rhizosphaerae]RZS34875.1 hypothetical protein EV193_108225 [Herbihabitans rhizosphaerae]